MRLALIADVHGNADALNAVLSDARALGAAGFIVNGDVVNRGPDSVQTLETLLNLPGTEFTLGNHDDLMLLWRDRSDVLPSDWFGDPFWGATAWSADQLDRAGLLDPLRSWPMSLTLDEVGLPRVVISHGTPQHYRESLSERSEPARVQDIAAETGAGLLVASHIHRPVDARFGSVRVINTGAVGSPADGDPRAQYVVLDATRDGWSVTFRRVHYEREGVLRRFERSGLLATGLSAEIFRDELITARSLYTPYWLWTESTGTPRTRESWAAFQHLHPELTAISHPTPG